MKRLFCCIAFWFIYSGAAQAAGDVYDPATGLLELSRITMTGSGDFCDLRLNLGADGAWSLLALSACAVARTAADTYDPATEILTMPRLTVRTMGDFCNVKVRLGLADGRWELRSVESCSAPVDPGSCQPTQVQFDRIQVGMDFEAGYGTGTPFEEAVSIMGCSPLSLTEQVQCGEGDGGNIILCQMAVWRGTDNKELSILFSYGRGAVTKNGYGFWHLPDGQVVPYF